MLTTRTLPTWAAVLALVLATAACEGEGAGTPDVDTAPVAPAEVDRPAPASTPVEPVSAVMTEPLPSGWQLIGTGPRVVVTSDYGADGRTSTYHLYGPGTTSGGQVVVGEQWDESRVEAQWVAVQRDVQPGIAMALVSVEQTPNDGLQAGGRELVIRTFDVDGTARGKSSIPIRDGFSADRGVHHVGLIGDTLVLVDDGLTTDPGNAVLAEAVDVGTGALLWSSACGDQYATSDPMYAGPGVVAVGCNYGGIRGFDLATGATLWEQTGGTTQDFSHDPSAPGVLSAAEYAGSADVTIDLTNGSALADAGQGVVLGDPVTGLQAMGALEVYDPTSHATVLSIAPEAIDDLGDFTPVSAFDGRLTFLARDGLSVVSLTTGSADPSSPAKSSQPLPYSAVVADAGTGWVLVGSVDAGWDPDSWVRTAPVTPYAVMWATGADGTIGWDDVGGPVVAAG